MSERKNMYKNLLVIFALIFLSGCVDLSKKTPPTSYYNLSYKGQKCHQIAPNASKIYIANVRSLNLFDSKTILVIDGDNKVIRVDDAKYIAPPSQMAFNAIVDAIASKCEFKELFRPSNDILALHSSLLSFLVDDKKAKIALAYELKKGSKTLKQGTIEKSLQLENLSSKKIIKGMESCLNLVIDELLKEIK